MSSEETHTSSLLYFMPSWIFEHKGLTQTQKMIYALLSGLAHGNEEKTCFPSDEYISKRIGIRPEGANKAIAKLCEIGAISKVVYPHPQNPFKKKRTITVYLSSQKILKYSDKSQDRSCDTEQPRDSEKSQPRGSEKSQGSNKAISNKERSISKDIDTKKPKKKIHDHVHMSQEELEKLRAEYGETKTSLFIKKLDAYIGSKGKKYKSHYKTIISWILKEEGDRMANKHRPPHTKKGRGVRPAKPPIEETPLNREEGPWKDK